MHFFRKTALVFKNRLLQFQRGTATFIKPSFPYKQHFSVTYGLFQLFLLERHIADMPRMNTAREKTMVSTCRIKIFPYQGIIYETGISGRYPAMMRMYIITEHIKELGHIRCPPKDDTGANGGLSGTIL